jgi:hypothetical protein
MLRCVLLCENRYRETTTLLLLLDTVSVHAQLPHADGTYVDPAESSLLPRDDLVLLEPEVNLLLCVLDGIGTVANVPADIL